MTLQEQDTAREIRGLRAQLMALGLAFLVVVGFQSFQLVRDRIALLDLRTAQEPTVQQGLKLRQQVDSIASGIAQLASAGDVSAQAIINDLRRQGIMVRPPGTPATK
ncbi:MAG TPA: hypothetical protein VNH44_03805 [Micropepsaceae bacterium]|nr:hypothetical protein [Micropepsaceae bacterium]